MIKNGAQIVLEALRAEGVEVVFGYPGGAVLDLYDAIYKEKFPHVLVRHEQGAAHAADGYARATGKVGVAIATSGPGATNLVTGIATAHMDSIPMVCITGQVGNPFIGRDSFQEADICGITTPITKHNYLVKDVKELPRVLKEAFFIASTGRTGPVVVDIAKDVFTATVDFTYPETVNLHGYSGKYPVKEESVNDAVALIGQAKQPVFILGGGVTLSNTSEVFRDILDVTGVPVATTLMGIGCVRSQDEDFLGMAGMHGTYAANMAISECDVLVAVGMRFDDRVTSRLDAFAPYAKIVHFEIDSAELGKNVDVGVSVAGDLRLSLPLFLEKLRAAKCDYRTRFEAWRTHTRKMKASYPLTYTEREGLIMPQALIEEIGSIMDEDTILVTDVGQHQMWSAQFYPASNPRQFLTSGGLGTMGYGLPAALGAKVGEKGKKVVLVTGDGSFMMNCQELATAADNGIDVKVVIVHNRVLGMVTQWQKLFYEKHYSHTLLTTKTDFVALAKAMGVSAVRIEDAKTWRAELKEALTSEGARVIDVLTPSNVDVLPMVPGGKRLDEMVLEEDDG